MVALKIKSNFGSILFPEASKAWDEAYSDEPLPRLSLYRRLWNRLRGIEPPVRCPTEFPPMFKDEKNGTQV